MGCKNAFGRQKYNCQFAKEKICRRPGNNSTLQTVWILYADVQNIPKNTTVYFTTFEEILKKILINNFQL